MKIKSRLALLLCGMMQIILFFSLTVNIFAEESICPIKGEALLIGLTSIDPMEYGTDGTDGCWGCENDVDLMNNILSSNGFNVSQLLTQSATHDNILSRINQIKGTLYAGDTFVIYFSGHGEQVADSNGDETDGLDETLVAYDKEIIDDELDTIWRTFPIGVKIVMISDSCHSGTAYKSTMNQRALVDTSTMDASLIHISGCRDNQFSNGDWDNGIFTKALGDVWDNGSFNGNYQTLCEQINSRINDSEQISEYHEYGNVLDNYRCEKPFTINKTPVQVSSFNDLKEGDQILFKCLGDISGNRWLDGRTADSTVGLSSQTGGKYTGSHWSIYKFQ
ncbi:caspase family protein [Ruminiclostridium herbifermentans]|uniref:Caspase family protein n=1 Tax=Ruminiclostridium herbifermentans TaxID=2488810 RepID=A0A4U7J9M7_9FIRM|nr:caspase family protein [Ruminiclostridium herbifermentans]QNU66509.1 caspase family protein [Ruminiclostridium herbifermentans]